MQPEAKMSSGQATFDLKAAREICSRIKGYEDPDGGNFADFQAAEMLPVALDEIERLQKENLELNVAIVGPDQIRAHQKCIIDDQAKRIAELEADLEYYKSGFHSERGVHERVAAILGTDDAPWMLAQRAIERIAELEESLQRERAMTFSKIQRQRHAIARLSEAKRKRGKALVEERISGEFSDWIENQCPHWDIDEEPFCVELDGPCEYMEGKCPISMELHRIAREQLRLEGKL